MHLDPVAHNARVRIPDKAAYPPRGVPDGDALEDATARALERLAGLQQLLHADGRYGMLVVLQGRDASGKDGVIRRVLGACNPLGVRVAAFAAPTEDERQHDFLWRVHQQTPRRGQIGVFNRSHYEDVLVVRVRGLAPKKVWKARYDQINAFESTLTAAGIVVVKFFLHVSRAEQERRLLDRLDDPTEHWKFNRGDLAVRERWDDYQAAYTEAIARTTTDEAPWFVVPADRKWYRNWAVSTILVEALEALDPQFPVSDGLSDITVT